MEPDLNGFGTKQKLNGLTDKECNIMSSEINWIKESDLLGSATSPGIKNLQAYDPYGAWGTTFGAPHDILYRVRENLPQDANEQDYLYTQSIDTSGHAGKITPIPLKNIDAKLTELFLGKSPNLSDLTRSQSIALEQIRGLDLLLNSSSSFTIPNLHVKLLKKSKKSLAISDKIVFFRVPLKTSSLNPLHLEDASSKTKIKSSVTVKDADFEQTRLADIVDLIGTENMTDDIISSKANLVITGVIDDAINIAHEKFYLEKNGKKHSRVDFAWIQDAPYSGDKHLPFGRQLTRLEIEKALKDHSTSEDALMHDLDVTSRSDISRRAASLRTTHGTHVLDLAAGYSEATENDIEAKNHRIITVQMPSVVTKDTTGSMLLGMAHHGLRFIFERAKALSIAINFPIPVVINFSYGVNKGPHNGNSVLEKTFRNLAQNYKNFLAEKLEIENKNSIPVELVLPSGNQRQAQIHAQVHQEANDLRPISFKLPWRLQPSDQSSNFVEIWLPENTKLDHVFIKAPNGSVEPITDRDGTANIVDDSGSISDPILLNRPTQELKNNIIGRITLDKPSSVPQGQIQNKNFLSRRLLIALAPTQAKTSVSPIGIWEIDIQVSGLSEGGSVHAWIQRDDSAVGYSSNHRPSYFDDPNYMNSRFNDMSDLRVNDQNKNEFITRFGTISGMATRNMDVTLAKKDKHIIFVGGYQNNEKRVAPYSGRGSDATDKGVKISGPDVLAVSDRSRVMRGIPAAGTRSGTKTVLSGTSVASPQVAKLVAQEISRIPPDKRHSFNSFKLFKPRAQPSAIKIQDAATSYSQSVLAEHGNVYVK